MQTLIRSFRMLVLFVSAGLLWSCSEPNPDAPVLNASGNHIDNWIVEHQASYVRDKDQCKECHGSDLLGGISRVSCFASQSGGRSCHAQGPLGHPAGWRDPALHGADAKSQPGPNTGFSNCLICHGTDFSGGVSAVSCFTGSRDTGTCHVTNGAPIAAPHAPAPWRTYPFPTHTDTVDDELGSNATACALCHTAGANLSTAVITTYSAGKPGCFTGTLCHRTMGHPAGWAQPANHGQTAKSNLTYCQQCHADNRFGGPGSKPRFNVQLGRLVDAASGTSGCEVCHAPLSAHPPVVRIPSSFGTITSLIPLNTPWYLHCKANPSGFDACNRCHGANPDGVDGVAGATGCAFCHRIGLPTTLKNCTSCHSSPPGGTVYPDNALAHPAHAGLNTADVCGVCHQGLGSITLDHLLRARNRTVAVQAGAVAFGAFAKTGGLIPAYNETTTQCNNTYCHGATLSGGANKSPLWTDVNYLSTGCGTCHGFPPPTSVHAGFTSATVCKTCHTHVNAANTGFGDPAKHVNGAVDVASGASHSFPNPGSTHASTAGAAPFAGCVTSGCHTNGSAVGVYPVATGTPPDCRACHTKAGPGNSCGSCHGNASSNSLSAGRPNGSAFPDVAGRHSSPHSSFACSLCHGSNGTGNAAHGPSNRIAHGDADVSVQFTGEAAAMVFTRSGLNNGRGTCNGSCHGKSHSDNW